MIHIEKTMIKIVAYGSAAIMFMRYVQMTFVFTAAWQPLAIGIGFIIGGKYLADKLNNK